MTQQTQGAEHNGATVYDDYTPAPQRSTAREVEMTVVTPTDRVRWGPIVAGLFTALTTGLLLSLAALAFGLNQFDPNSTARSFGIGAGVTGAVIWLLAFGVGGYVAARTAALPGRSNGIFNGLMVSLVGIPLLLWGLSSVVGGLLGTTGSIAGTAAQVAAPVAGQAADDPAAQDAAQQAQDTAQQAQDTAQQQLEQVNPEQVADAARNTALGALLPLVLGLAAAGAGGALGARTPDDDEQAVQA